MKLSTQAYTAIVIAAALSRLVPHPPNFTVIGALALFGGASFEKPLAAYLVPLAAMLLSDAVIGFHGGMPVIYLCFLLTTFLGRRMRGSRNIGMVARMSFLSSVMFYVITNFAVWAGGSMYPHTTQGLVLCYTAAIPFFGNTLAGTMIYSAVLFAAADLADRAVLAAA
jgi:hypothetical protein